MIIVLKVTVEVNRTSGKFESKDSIAEFIRSEVESADPGSFQGPDYDGEWEVTSFEVEVAE